MHVQANTSTSNVFGFALPSLVETPVFVRPGIKRKLSKSLHTVFSGRILMFLAAVTPLTDKSGSSMPCSAAYSGIHNR